MLQVQQDLIEQAFKSTHDDDIPKIKELDTTREEQLFTVTLIQHQFMIGEIEEETSIILTIIAIILSIVILVVSCYFCYYGLIKP